MGSATDHPVRAIAPAAGAAWYVAHTHVHAEAKAAFHLARQGFATYLPRYLRKRRHARRVDMVAASLFPRYLFVSFDPGVHPWRSIHSTIGVSHLVCNGDMPAIVPSNIIADLRASEDECGYVGLQKGPRFAPGDRVRVVDGAFDECLGLYEGMADNDRVRILLDLLGRKVRVSLDVDAIAAA
jgi:transcriptional antiterminator RfaH